MTEAEAARQGASVTWDVPRQWRVRTTSRRAVDRVTVDFHPVYALPSFTRLISVPLVDD